MRPLLFSLHFEPTCRFNSTCKNTTGKPIPPQWKMHYDAGFTVLPLHIFFQPMVEGKLIDEKYRMLQSDIDALDDLVCPEHLPEWQRKNAIGRKISQAAKRRKANATS